MATLHHKLKTQGLAMEQHIENPIISAKEERVNIPKTNTMTVYLFIVKAEILKLREVWDMFEVQRKKHRPGKQLISQ